MATVESARRRPCWLCCGKGCAAEDKVDESEHGKFGWVLDPEVNKIELWQPPQGQ